MHLLTKRLKFEFCLKAINIDLLNRVKIYSLSKMINETKTAHYYTCEMVHYSCLSHTYSLDNFNMNILLMAVVCPY